MQSVRPARQVEYLHTRVPAPLADAVRSHSEASGMSVSEILRAALAARFFPFPVDREARP